MFDESFGEDASTHDEPVVLDPVMIQIHGLARRVAASGINVLLLAETGSGKEILTETLHRHSGRQDLVRVNCAALPGSLIESELFGYEKGAFSGATHSKPGLLEMADQGTALLDEVGEMSLTAQAKLLRVIEDRAVMRVGGLKPKHLDVRFISATNRDLATAVACGRFRADLYHRLNGISIRLPPLRERPSEIDALARAFTRRAAMAAGLRIPPKLSAEVRTLLARHPWPGNIRELRNVIERAVALCGDTSTITAEHLWLDEPVEIPATSPSSGLMRVANPANDLKLTTPPLDERRRITEALARCGGNQSAAAKLLGVSRRTLVSRLVKHRIPRPRAGH